jgi:hypothetical protein
MQARRTIRALVTAGAFALAPMLAGCESFDPTSLTDFLPDTKKPLPGDRKAVFPDGVPGVSQGVPRELVKGYQAPPDPQVIAAPEEQPADQKPEQKAEEPKPKPKPKKVAAKPKPAAQPQAQQPQASQGASPWPAAPQPQGAQASGGGQPAWPAPPPPGQFSR